MILKEWHKGLVWEAKVLMDKEGYTRDQAMQKAWDMNYKGIERDQEVDVAELRELFWKDGFQQLEEYTEEIIRRYR